MKNLPKSLSTNLWLKLSVLNMEGALGSQKDGAQSASVNPDFVPLKTTRMSWVPFGTPKNSVTFSTLAVGTSLM